MPNVRALVALVSFGLLAACFPAKSPQRSIFDCRIDALRPAVSTALDAADLAREVGAKRLPLRDALVGAGLYGAQLEAIARSYEACDAVADAGAAP